jgi:hypothetical protein
MPAPNLFKTRLPSRLALLAAASFLLLWLVSYVFIGLYESLNFDGFPADGPFQLFNPLRRIAAGQRAGADFQFFHGAGVPYLHYPLFLLFGKTIFASELSRAFTSLACYLLSLGLFAFAVTGGRGKRAFCFVALALWLSEIFLIGKPGLYGNPLASPGNSLLSVRSTFPLVTFAILLSGLPRAAKAMFAGAGLALALFCGTEHGLALSVSFFFVGACVAAKSLFAARGAEGSKLLRSNVGFYALAGASAAVCGAALFVLTCGPRGALQALKYNLAEVPADQFWYFGVPPNDFAAAWSDFPHATMKGTLLFVIAACWLLACLWMIFRSPKVTFDARPVTTAQMLCYGLIACASCLGMLEKGYLAPLLRIFLLVVLSFAFQESFLQTVGERLSALSASTRRTAIIGAAALALISLASVSFALYSRIPDPALIFNASVPRLSPLWTKYVARVTEAVGGRLAPGEKPVIWSTYSGLLETHYGVFHPKDDYIIHALGPRRREAYLTAFRATKPQIVQTIRRTLFIRYTEQRDYEQWLRVTSWDFYEDILNNYDVLTTTDSSIIWVRKNAEWVGPTDSFTPLPLEGAFDRAADCVELPPVNAAEGVVVVRLRYEVDNPWKKLPFIGGLPRHLVFPENTGSELPVSLPPYAGEVRFPLYAKPGVRPRLKFATKSLVPGPSFAVKEVAYKTVPVAVSQRIFLED